ncbi:MAG: hypothetical protein IPJ98_28320 [Bryobacterales bacterium]|nr:hypothetical protein [Bryobacterales bacterium]
MHFSARKGEVHVRIDWNNPTTLWLNLTNAGLGLFVLGSVAVLIPAVAVELAEKFRASLRQGDADAGGGQLMPSDTPELGLTMAHCV